MAREKGEYQKRKERQNKIKSVLCVFFFVVFIPLILVYGIVENAFAIQQINDHTLTEYTGSYTYHVKKRYGKHAKTYYEFTLDNGDVVTIRAKYCQNREILGDSRELTIMYHPILTINGFSNTFTAVSITTPDGEVVIRDLDKTYSLRVANIWIISISLVLSISIAIFILVILFYLGDWKKRIIKWRKMRSKRTE